jgi:hypothetical protein
MAIGRTGMTKEMFGNRTKKMNTGGAMPPGDGGKKSFSEALGTAKTPSMKKGGMVTRGDGCCIKGKTKGTMC